jgi:hypothetical protein
MSPRPPISVPTLVPPSQSLNGRGEQTYSRIVYDAEEGDGHSSQSEPRNGYGSHDRGGSSASLGGVSGPRPLPPRSGSAEKMNESWKYNPLPQMGFESPHVVALTTF